MATGDTSAIIPQYDINKIAKKYKETYIETVLRVLNRLCFIGEECVKIARDNGDYNDITGNLRSSIGYMVLNNGVEYHSAITKPTSVEPGYRTVKRNRKDSTEYTAKQKVGGNGAQGTKSAKSLLDKLKSKYPSGCVLIICAGMQYAAYVENIHGKRVLVDAKLKAKQLADKFFNK